MPEGEPVARGNGPDDDNGNGNNGNAAAQRSAKANRVLENGLEYVAEYDMAEIPEGIDFETSQEDMPDTNPNHDSDDRQRFLNVLGADTRFQQDGFDWPNWRLTELDYWSSSSGSYRGRCSGTIIGTNKVLSAAHCVYNTGSRSWMVPGRVAPGRSGSWDPWGRWYVSYATVYTAYLNGGGNGYDIAVLTIANSGTFAKTNIGSYMGYLGMRTQPCSYTESQWRITGYPGDKPDGTMWNTGVCDDWYYSCLSNRISHQCDTAGGMSGSGIRDGSNRVVGVHTHGGRSWNSGTALNSYHMSNVQYW